MQQPENATPELISQISSYDDLMMLEFREYLLTKEQHSPGPDHHHQSSQDPSAHHFKNSEQLITSLITKCMESTVSDL